MSFFTFLHDKKYLKLSKCVEGVGQLNVNPNWDIVKCAHHKIITGNIAKNDVNTAWKEQSLKIAEDNNAKTTPNHCKFCEYSEICKGGCPGIRLAYYGSNENLYHDPCCFKDDKN